MRTIKNENEEKVTKLSLASQQLSHVPDYVFELYDLLSLDLNYNHFSFIPSDICDKLRHLTHLYLSGNALFKLPDNIGILIHLIELHVNENELQTLPSSISELKYLKRLHLTNNLLSELPCINGLYSLTELIVDENSLTSLPENIDCLVNLERLEASYNYLSTLPENFGNLSKLKCLNLSNNSIQKVPESFCNLPSLLEIDLSDNRLTNFPDNFQSAHSLQKFFVDRNQLCLIPSWFSSLGDIMHISAIGNNFRKTTFPDNFGSICKKLKHLDFSGNYLEMLPDSFSELESLEYMDMGSTNDEIERRRNFQYGNILQTLPLNFGKLYNLRQLYLDENCLESLPKSFGDLVNLEYLDLSHNYLAHLPESFGRLQSLEVCLLSINVIGQLPSNFGNLKKLKELRLDNNQLCELPQSFCQLEELRTLDLYKNRLVQLPLALKFLTRLTRLDLNENDFESSWESLVDDSLEAQMSTADEGKDTINKCNILSIENTKDFSDEKNNYQSNFTHKELCRIRDAMKEGAAIWRHHRDGLINSRIQQTVEENDEELWDLNLNDNKNNGMPENSYIDDDWVGYWENGDWDSNLYVYQRTSGGIYGDPAKDQFLPADIHPLPIQRSLISFSIEDGQFDDVC